LPPPGIEIPDDVRQQLDTQLAALTPRIEKLPERYRPDVEVFTKAVRFALRFGEFYDKKDFDKARWALTQAAERLAAAENNTSPWTKQTGLVVRGYRSTIDGSVQPYGLVIPKDHDFSKPCPLYVWLHGRGDKETDLHFVYGRARNKGEVAPENAIVVHPFGRQCLGFKSAGEIDVLDVTKLVQAEYNTQKDHTVLIGFSMGGAGAWHVGAHYADHWCAIAPGAGFAETARYQNLKPENYPPAYEQALWGVYDVPDYVRNLFNVPVIAYSGENDKQIQAARVMEEAFAAEGQKLTHLIGPGMGHQYHPEVKKDLLARLAKTTEAARTRPREVSLQTRTLRYNAYDWVSIEGLGEHWKDARVDAKYAGNKLTVSTRNVTRLRLERLPPLAKLGERELAIDGQMLPFPSESLLERSGDKWSEVKSLAKGLRKRPKQQGPIDDAFLEPFLVVLPSGKSKHPRVGQWVDFEAQHFRERWSATFRGNLRVVRDDELLNDRDLHGVNVILWGDPSSNSWIERSLSHLPLKWDDQSITLAGKTYDAATHVPLLIYPSPFDPERYVVLNSGPTFREAHDRTNSLQNPKLPDWAVLDITTPPSASAAGKIVAAEFFDEEWKVKK
jgi:predicted esterase